MYRYKSPIFKMRSVPGGQLVRKGVSSFQSFGLANDLAGETCWRNLTVADENSSPDSGTDLNIWIYIYTHTDDSREDLKSKYLNNTIML